jgi:hypothetical protein
VLGALAHYLQGLPGRKNLIWFSEDFPLALFHDEKGNLQYAEEVKHICSTFWRATRSCSTRLIRGR